MTDSSQRTSELVLMRNAGWTGRLFWPALRPMFIELIRTPPANRDATVISRAERLSLAAAQILDARLSDRTFLAGESFSMRDIPAATTFIVGTRLIFIIPNCPTSTDGINSSNNSFFRRLKRPPGHPPEQDAGQGVFLRARHLRASKPAETLEISAKPLKGLRGAIGHGP
jgi:glutathione S-transferase